MRVKFIEQQYAPRAAVPHSRNYLAEFKKRVPQTLKPQHEDIRYGPNARELLDIYRPKKNYGVPVLLWYHGGGWRANTKNNYYHLAQSLTPSKIMVVPVEYDLAPYVTIDTIIEEAKRSVIWVAENIEPYGGDSDKIYIAGHSAGAQICAMILQDKNIPNDLVKGALLISGLYNLMLMQLMLNEPKMTVEQCIRNSPTEINSSAYVECCVGADEPEGFKSETFQYALEHGLDYFEVPDAHHYTMNKDMLADENSPVIKSLKKIMLKG